MSQFNTQNKNNAVFSIRSGGLTDTGHKRQRNEDSILMLPKQNFWLVADGMGGHHAGDFASQTITSNAEQFTQQASLEQSIMALEDNFLQSNKIIRAKSSKTPHNKSIGSTLVCLYIWKNLAFTIWAGDSRLYRFRHDKLERMTEDHSYVEELVKMGKLEAAEAEKHPASNIILRAIGIEDELKLDIDYSELEAGDIFLLCSDGLYKDLSEDEIITVIKNNSQDMDILTQSLLSKSLAAGGTDNTSVIAINVLKEKTHV